MSSAWKRIAIAVVALSALAAAWRFTPLADLLTAARIAHWAHVFRASVWAGPVVVLAYTPAALLMFPQPLLTLFAVFSFGPWRGAAYALAGILLAALVTYGAGRFLRYDSIRRLSGGRADVARELAQEHGILAVLAANLVPVPPFAVQGFIAGAIRVRVWHYAVGTLLGTAPGVLAISFFGRQLTAALAGGSASAWATAALTLAVFAAFALAARRWAVKRRKE